MRFFCVDEREKSLLPGTQPLVQQKLNKCKYKDEIEELKDENAMFEELINQNNGKIRKLKEKMDGNGNMEEKKKVKTVKLFRILSISVQ